DKQTTTLYSVVVIIVYIVIYCIFLKPLQFIAIWLIFLFKTTVILI
ncbi:unnamed protein product, partial [marine sediment metagenome]